MRLLSGVATSMPVMLHDAAHNATHNTTHTISQYNGMRVITEDPDGFERHRFIKVLSEEAKRGDSTK